VRRQRRHDVSAHKESDIREGGGETGSTVPATVSCTIRRYEDGAFTVVEDDVLTECELSIYLDDVFLVKLICTPQQLDDLVLGYLCSDGLLATVDDLASLEIDGTLAKATSRRNAVAESADEAAALVVTDSGDFASLPAGMRRKTRDVPLRQPPWDPQTILANANLLLSKSALFGETGNVHSVAICRDADLLYFREDVGRYNAFDKCVGRALRDDADLSDTCVYTTGRLPSSMVLKTIRAGIPMIVSRSAPTDASVALAKAHGLTVVGFARAGRFNLYTSPD